MVNFIYDRWNSKEIFLVVVLFFKWNYIISLNSKCMLTIPIYLNIYSFFSLLSVLHCCWYVYVFFPMTNNTVWNYIDVKLCHFNWFNENTEGNWFSKQISKKKKGLRQEQRDFVKSWPKKKWEWHINRSKTIVENTERKNLPFNPTRSRKSKSNKMKKKTYSFLQNC